MVQMIKKLPAIQGTWVWSLGRDDSVNEENGNPLQYSCRERLLSMGLEIVKHDWATNTFTFIILHNKQFTFCIYFLLCLFYASILIQEGLFSFCSASDFSANLFLTWFLWALRQFSVFPGTRVVPQLYGVLAVRQTRGCLLPSRLIFWLHFPLGNFIISSWIYKYVRNSSWVDTRSGPGDTTVKPYMEGLRIFIAGCGLQEHLRGESLSFALDWCSPRASQVVLVVKNLPAMQEM